MPTDPININGRFVDLSSRILVTTTVVASPAAAAETIIAQLPAISNLTIVAGVDLSGWAAYTVGTNGTTVQFRIRQTNASGTIVGNTGAMSGSQHGAAILSADDCEGYDASPAAAQVYVLTMQVANGSAASTVSAVKLRAIVV